MIRTRRGRLSCLAASFSFVAALALVALPSAQADILHGIGVMGDSASVKSPSYKWPVQLQTNRGLNFGGSGLPYDYAVGGAASASLLSSGQHTKMRTDVLAGKVTLGITFIGNNDWLSSSTGQAIIAGTATSAQQTAFQNAIVNNIKTAVNTELTAGIQGMLLGSVEDLTLTPAAQSILDPGNPDSVAAAARLQASIGAVNSQLIAYAQTNHLPYVDFFALGDAITTTGFTVGGVNISLAGSGSDPHNFWIDDLHPGIIGNALLGNMWMKAINIAYGTNLLLYTDQQMLALAGLGSSYTGETFSNSYNLANYIYFTPVPEPATQALAAAALVSLAAFGYRKKKRVRTI